MNIKLIIIEPFFTVVNKILWAQTRKKVNNIKSKI